MCSFECGVMIATQRWLAAASIALALTAGAACDLQAQRMASRRSEDAMLFARRFSQCYSWQVVVFPSGIALSEYESTCYSKWEHRLWRITPSAIDQLRRVLGDARFFELKIPPPDFIVPDDDMLTLRAWTGREEHAVLVQGDQLRAKTALVQRFDTVWKAIDQLIPEPEYHLLPAPR